MDMTTPTPPPEPSPPTRLGRLPAWLRYIHWFILVNLIGQIGYIGWQVFVVLQPDGVTGPMFGAALQLPHEQMVVRRMYAAEGWYAAIGLALYLAVTEILPRRLDRTPPPPH
jgi:hypothetical protein